MALFLFAVFSLLDEWLWIITFSGKFAFYSLVVEAHIILYNQGAEYFLCIPNHWKGCILTNFP